MFFAEMKIANALSPEFGAAAKVLGGIGAKVDELVKHKEADILEV